MTSTTLAVPRTTGKRTRVERGVYRRTTADGVTRYEVVVVEDGRNRWHTFPSLDAARKGRAKLVSTLTDGGTVTTPKPVKLAEYATRWLDAQAGTVRPSTLESYRSHWRTHLDPALGSRKVSSVTVADVRRLVADLRDAGKASATTRRVLQVLSLMYADAVEERLALTNPVAALPRRDRRAIRQVRGTDFPVLTVEQVRALVASTPERHRLVLAVAVLTGLRQGELLGLRWQDVTRDADGLPVLRVRFALDRHGKLVEPKTPSAIREVPITLDLARALTEHRLASGASGDDDYVFTTRTGSPLHFRNLARRALDPALAAAKLPRLTWHDLRHVAASVLIGGGASVVYVSRTLGHSNPAVTLSTYSHLFAAAEHAAKHREHATAAFAGVLS